MKKTTLKLVHVSGLRRKAAPISSGKDAFAKSRLFLVARLTVGTALALTATAMLAQASSSSDAVFPDGRNAGPDVSVYVSPNLEAREQEYMRYAMNQLPARMKEKMLRTDPTHVSITVYDGATGEAHYNRPELKGRLRLESSRSLPGDDYPLASAEDRNGSLAAGPDRVTSCGASPAPGCTSGAGPYRRIFTPQLPPEIDCPSGVPRPCGPGTGTNDGYWVSGTVTTACKAGSFKKDDIGFVFLGGYSKTPDETGGSVDAGLQYNYEDDPSLPNLDNYEMFIGIKNEPKLVYSSNFTGEGTGKELINCGGNVTMEFRVAPWELGLNSRPGSGCVSSKTVNNPWLLKACGTIAFILERGRGGIGEEYNDESIVWIAPSFSFGGWGQEAVSPQNKQTYYWPQTPCGGCIFKWTTGIGQEQENLTDGSLYSATWSNLEIAPWATDPSDITNPPYGNGVPMTAKLTLCTEYPLWRGTYDGATSKADCSDTPGNITGNAGDVKVAKYSVGGELDSITLTDKGLPSIAH